MTLLKRTAFLLQNPMGSTFSKELQQAMVHSNEAVANTMRKTFGVFKNPHPGIFNEWPTMLFNTLEGFNDALERDELVAKMERISLN